MISEWSRYGRSAEACGSIDSGPDAPTNYRHYAVPALDSHRFRRGPARFLRSFRFQRIRRFLRSGRFRCGRFPQSTAIASGWRFRFRFQSAAHDGESVGRKEDVETETESESESEDDETTARRSAQETRFRGRKWSKERSDQDPRWIGSKRIIRIPDWRYLIKISYKTHDSTHLDIKNQNMGKFGS